MFSQTIHADTARRNVQLSWTFRGEALFPGHLPQRRVTLPAVGLRVEVWASSRLGSAVLSHVLWAVRPPLACVEAGVPDS